MILKIVTIKSSDLTVIISAFIILTTILALSLESPAYAATRDFPNSDINWYDKALSVNQNNVPALVEKGTDLVATGNPAQAISLLDKALGIDSENMMGLVSKGAALRDLGKYQEAIITYDKVLEIDPHDTYAIGGKADSLYMSGQHQQAITWIDKALELNPDDAKIQFVQASIHQQIN